MTTQLVSSPDELPNEEFLIRHIVEFWNDLRNGGEPGATTWEVLDELEQQVTGYLALSTPDVLRAGSLTCRAKFLIIGCSDL